MGLRSMAWGIRKGVTVDSIRHIIQEQKQVANSINDHASRIRTDIKNESKLDKKFEKIANLAKKAANKQTKIQVKFQRRISRAQTKKNSENRIRKLERAQFLEMAYVSHKYLNRIRGKVARTNIRGFEEINRDIQSLHGQILAEIKRLLVLEKESKVAEEQKAKEEKKRKY